MKVFIEAYLFGNLGDDLFVDILTERYPDTEFVAVSHFYKSESGHMKVYNDRLLSKIFSPKTLQRICSKKCEIVISIGGSMYIEGISEESAVPELGKKFYIIGANFGPYRSREYVEKHRNIFTRAEDVCFREDFSYQLFREITNVRKAPDIVFSCKSLPDRCSKKHRVVMSVIDCREELEVFRERYHLKMAEMAEEFVHRGYEVCFMSFCQVQGDERAVNRIRELCKVNTEMYFYRGNRREALQILSDCEIVVGTRFHANVLGFLFHKIVFPIIYSEKTSHMLNDLGFQGKRISLDEIDKFEPKNITEQDLQYRLETGELREQAEEQFLKLDKVLS